MDLFSDFIIGFLIGKVIINYIIGHWVAEQILKYTSRYASTKSTRVAALWFHFMEKVQGENHEKDLLDCRHRRCAIL